jgi:hypothetical protein
MVHIHLVMEESSSHDSIPQAAPILNVAGALKEFALGNEKLILLYNYR